MSVVPTSVSLSSFCGSMNNWNGGAPACASVEVMPVIAPQNTPATARGFFGSAGTRPSQV